MRISIVAWSLLCSVASTNSTPGLLPNVNAIFEPWPKPFTLAVDPVFIESLRQRVGATRLPVEPQGQLAPGTDGPPVANATTIRDYWVEEYDWDAVQAAINKGFKQFTIAVEIHQANHSRSIPLHYVHHRSPRADAIPLLFVHGWPGSFLEVKNIIGNLTNPPNSSVPAFHVIAPSIPGFGFSPAPLWDGFGPDEAGQAFNALMVKLGYEKYVYQAGDFGGLIFPYLAARYPENLISGLSNFWLVQPNATDLARYERNESSVDESAYIKNILNFINNESGYRIVQQTSPLSLAYALTDSPLGFALWIYNLMRVAIDPTVSTWTREQIITWSLMYTIQGPYGGLRLYEMMLREGAFAGFGIGLPPYVKQPVAVSQFPYDVWYHEPLDWAQRQGNVKRRFIHDHGGHFAAWDTPEALLEDIWIWFGDREASNTKVFHGQTK
ncbi:hypothetical protein LTS12_015076 [Elasticomyces elasticus]|nr:hypothetical protein LTS12_015076 [Elasticomyces elasticus]